MTIWRRMPPAWAAIMVVAALQGCATGGPDGSIETAAAEQDTQADAGGELYASTYQPLPSGATVITGATVLTGTGARLDGATVVIRDGKIESVGVGAAFSGDAETIDATGKWVTPGVIDVHSHLGVYASPNIKATSDGNEATNPNTAEVWAEHSVRPNDPGFTRALAGGVTSMQILPGSANLFGGRGVTVKNVPSRTMQGMKFPGAPHGLKMACGENPKRVYGGRQMKRAPSTAMGNVAGYRAAWVKAAAYKLEWERYNKKKAEDEDAKPPKRDLQMDTLVGVLKGEILVHNHCYRGDEMAIMLDIAAEFGYRVTAFHHAVEAYKVADILAEHDVCAAMWADWWGFKLEAYDGIKENIAFVDNAKACAIVHSDSAVGIQRLNQEAAKAMASGNAAGLDISRAEAIRWITINAAKALGIADRTGSLEPGKMADVVIWDGDPFSVYTKAEKVFIDGALIYDRDDKARQPIVDFELGQTFEGGK